MKGEDNLIPMSERSKEEVRAIASKGGKASGKVRKEKAALRDTFYTLLSAPVKDKDYKAELKEAGITPDTQGLVALKVIQQAISGDMQAAKLLFTAIGEADPAALEIARMRVELALSKAEQSTAAEQPETNFIAALNDTAAEIWGADKESESNADE